MIHGICLEDFYDIDDDINDSIDDDIEAISANVENDTDDDICDDFIDYTYQFESGYIYYNMMI